MSKTTFIYGILFIIALVAYFLASQNIIYWLIDWSVEIGGAALAILLYKIGEEFLN